MTKTTEIDADLQRFYDLMAHLAERNGTRRLFECHGRMDWPTRGVYFFFENGETRPDGTPRVVRVGTHAVSEGSRTTLWNRLSQHRGTMSGGGNHRGSIFRLHVGGALLDSGRVAMTTDTWGQGSNAPKEVRSAEATVEQAVSAYIGAMPLTWVDIDDEPSKHSKRAMIEQNALGLLSAAIIAGMESPSSGWLGHQCRHSAVRSSGLWNVKHIQGQYDPRFLDEFASIIGGQ